MGTCKITGNVTVWFWEGPFGWCEHRRPSSEYCRDYGNLDGILINDFKTWISLPLTSWFVRSKFSTKILLQTNQRKPSISDTVNLIGGVNSYVGLPRFPPTFLLPCWGRGNSQEWDPVWYIIQSAPSVHPNPVPSITGILVLKSSSFPRRSSEVSMRNCSFLLHAMTFTHNLRWLSSPTPAL